MNEALTLSREVEQAVAPLLERDGYEVVLVEFVPRGRILRLYVDRRDHVRGVGVDDCARVSQLVGDVLDAEGISDKIPGRYHLEVSSPGLDRPLVKPQDFRRFVGHKASITTREPQAGGRRNFHGELAEAGETSLRIVVDSTSFVIAYDAIARAKLVPEL